MSREVELKVKVELPEGFLQRIIDGVAEGVGEQLDRGTRQPVEAPPNVPKLLIVGHEVVVPRLDGFQPVAEKVQQFGKLNKASEDVAIYLLNRLSLWKAAELGLTPDEVIEILKVHGRTEPRKSLRRWISRTMSTYGALRIVGEDNYNVLEAVDEETMDRVYAYRDVSSHIYRRLGPTRVRITSGHRAEIKRILIEKGYPTKDYGLIEEFKPLAIQFKPGVKLWPHQVEALNRFMEARNGVVILPPGSGKTLIGVASTVELQAPTLILSNRAQICEQFKDEYLKWTDISPHQIAVFHGGTSDRYVKPITMVTYQMVTHTSGSRQNRLVRDIWKTRWGLIVFDEVQHVPADLWRRTAEELQSLRKLGLTATPVREDKKEKEIFSLIGPPIVDVGWLEMEEEGRIAEATAYEVLVGMSPTMRATYRRANEWEKIILASNNPEKIRIVKQLLEKHRDDPTLIIGYYVDGAVKMATAINSEIIYGETSQGQRNKLYDAFRKDEIKHLVLTSVGEEGIDLPTARVAINIAGLYGSRMGFSQRFGRILRPKDETAIFYELVTEGTIEQDFSERRREYLVGQGYDFDVIDLTGG